MSTQSGKQKYQDRLAKKVRNKILTIQPGCCYYDISDEKPIGNRFNRAPDKGLAIGSITTITLWHGCNRTGHTINGNKKVAFNTEFTREHYYDK